MIPRKYLVQITLLISLSKVYGDVKSSLTFVIDDTSSMKNDIRQVKEATNTIFDTVLNSNESQIEDFVLVTFNDPDPFEQENYLMDTFNGPAFKVRSITNNRKEFKDALEAISVDGGGLCPEYSMAGILQGILHSRPRSTIYVFTDASAKDYKEYEQVRNTAIKRQAQVIFVLTGICGTENDLDYKVFYKLADDTEGAVFRLDKDDVNKIMNEITDAAKARRTTLGTWKLPKGTHNITVPIDGKNKEPKVTATGFKPKIDIFGPDGEKAKSKGLIETDKISIVKILEPKPGNHTVEIKSPSSETHVLITAKSEVKFLQGFSTFMASSIKETTTRPLPDVKSYITIQLTDGDIDLKTVKIIENEGDKLVKEVPLKVVNVKDKIYTTDLEEFPKRLFKLAIIGYDPVSRTNITRFGPPVEPQPSKPVIVSNKAPKASILGETTLNAHFNKPLEIKCLVQGHPKPNIVWVDNDTGKTLPATVSIIELPDYISILKVEKVVKTAEYECKADNPLGSDSKTVLVKTTVKPYLTMLSKSKDIFIDYLSEGTIACKVDAFPPASITWYKDRRVLTKDHVEFSDDNSVITIKEMHPYNEGHYICEARNSGGRRILPINVIITGVDAPVIDKSVTISPIMKGSNVVLPCKIIKGIPKPNITWYYSEGSSKDSTELSEWNNKEYVIVNNVYKSNEGIYTCEAKNDIGYDNHEYELVVEFPPAIRRDKTELKAKIGESLYISCYVDGNPNPRVVWYKDEVPLMASDKIHFYSDHSIRIRVGMDDDGVYKCNATNKLGTATKVVKVNVYEPVTIDPPKESKLDVNVGSTLSLPCKASGYPTPQTAWTYTSFNSSAPLKTLLKQLGPSSITLRYMQLAQEGYYTCNASNIAGSLLLTYEIRVVAPPTIENMYTEKLFKPVEGDLALMIKCTASGNPQPIIRWIRNGYYVAEGDDVYIENGTLILKDITKEAEGDYICEATNFLGSVRELYEVEVLSYPKPGHPTSNVDIREGQSVAVKCDLPHKLTDQLRWYKNGALIHKGELTIRNAKVSDGGLYTCRVSDFAKSTSAHTMVTVGYKPKFVSEVEGNIEFVDGSPTILNCQAYGSPPPKTTWWHNGELLNTTENYHYFEMELGSHGQYICEARNDFGNAVRVFNVTSKDCLIDIKKKPSKLQPLMMSNRLRWPHNTVKNGWISIAKNDYVFFLCPNGFKRFPQTQIMAFCDGGTKFKVQGVTYEYSSIECKKKVKHFVEKTGESCSSGKTELLRIVFKVLTETVEAYEVCMDRDHNTPAYTKQRMTSSVADVDYSETEWSDKDEIDLNFEEAYDRDGQVKFISSELGRPFHSDDKCSFGMRQLVSPKDLLPGVAQRSAYSYLNVVPHWSTCNNESNWNEVEQRVRTLAKSTYSELLVWTGVAEQLTMPSRDGDVQDIYIVDKDNVYQPVPRYLWKAVQNPATRSSLVIVQVNVPDLLSSDARAYVRCRDICNLTEWMRGSTWHDATRGYTFCCSLREFEKQFNYHGVFENHRNVLKYVSLIPEYRT